MKVLLIDPPGWQKHSVNLGLCYLAGTLASEDVDVKILDLNNKTYTEETIRGIVQDFQPRIIGFSVKTATAKSAARVAGRLKQFFSEAFYLAGGPHVTLCANEYLRENKIFDFGIVGDGETPLLELARVITKKLTDYERIKGLCFYKNNVLVCSEPYVNGAIGRLAFPRFESILNFDFQDFRYPLLTSRGCPYGCIFCCVGSISGKKWRPREPEEVVRELEDAVWKYQITSFEIMDDNFTLDIARAKSICRLLINKKLALEWWCHNGVRADKLDPELIGLMKKAGCQSIAIGIESGDPAVFNAVNKGEELADIVKAVRMIKKAGLRCVGYFIVGLPGDSIDSTRQTVKFQRNLQLFGQAYNIAIPYPGTKMAEHVRKHGKFLMDIQETYHFGDQAKVPFETGQLSKDTIEQCYHLVNNQGWVWGEDDLRKIRETFKSRYQRDVKRIVVLADEGLEGISKNMQIDYPDAAVIEIKKDNSVMPTGNHCPISPNASLNSFDSALQKLGKGEEFIVNRSLQTLFIRNMAQIREKQVFNEVLPDIREWDNPHGRYFATHLKHFSPSSQSAKNGTIYANGVALSFSPVPQWEKIACGKIESGLAFISLAAHNLSAVYTADYISINMRDTTKEVIVSPGVMPQDSLSILHNILHEADLFFVPESLTSFADVYSRAGINVVYHRVNDEKFALRYDMRAPFSGTRCSYEIRKRWVLNGGRKVVGVLRQIRAYARKVCSGIGLWRKIIALMLGANFRRLFTGFIRITR
jgi:anaerobic magnesium-protoporphyrin IX monomethyl ester cyclase